MTQKENTNSVLNKNNIGKNIIIKIKDEQKQLKGILKSYSQYEIHLQIKSKIYTINKGSVIYMCIE